LILGKFELHIYKAEPRKHGDRYQFLKGWTSRSRVILIFVLLINAIKNRLINFCKIGVNFPKNLRV